MSNTNNTPAILSALSSFAEALEDLGETTGAGMLRRRAKTLGKQAQRETKPLEPVEVLYADNGSKICVKTPSIHHKGRFYALLNKFKAVESREWDHENKYNIFSMGDKEAVLAILQSFFAGHKLISPEGEMVIPAAE
jgi:hypothetical protein